MKNFFITGSKTFIVILCLIGFVALYGAVTIHGAWHLLVISVLVFKLAYSLIRDLKRETQKH